MASSSKPFEALAIKWRSDVFFRARVKLAVAYVLILLVVIGSFSAVLYFNISSDIKESLDQALRAGVDPDKFFEDRQNHIFSLLLLVDGLILFAASALSYSFAGYTLKPIRTALQAQERFTADAAHELRTPLSIIQAQTEVLLRNPEPMSDKVTNGLDSILDETKHLGLLTKDLLLAARNASGQQAVYAPVDVSSAMADAVKRLRLISENADIETVSTLKPGTEVIADPEGLRRIFMNILRNALSFIPEGGQIRISLKSEGRMVCIALKDNGSGIPKQDLPYIFERFYKADNARQTIGTGLGLSIVKELAEAYGGRVGIISQEGRGTEVKIWLKRA